MDIRRGSLTVSASSIPADQTIMRGETSIAYLNLVLTAGSAENLRVIYVKLIRNSSGIGSDDDITNVALYDGSYRLTTKETLSGGYIIFDGGNMLSADGIDIPRGQQKIITVKADVPLTAIVGHQNSLGVVSIWTLGTTSNTNPESTLIGGPGSCVGVNTSCNSAPDAYEASISQ